MNVKKKGRLQKKSTNLGFLLNLRGGRGLEEVSDSEGSSPSKSVPDITLESTQEESAIAVSPAESPEGFMFSKEESQNHLN